MQEIDQIMHAANTCNQPCVFAMVVSTRGSTYRRPGAAMLIREDGSMVGAISGGCIEKEIVRRAKGVFETGQTLLIEYDGRFTLGCNGTLFILIELFNPPERQTLFNDYHEAFQSRTKWSVVANFQDDLIGTGFVFDQDKLFLISPARDTLNRHAQFQAYLHSSSYSDRDSAGWFSMKVNPSRRLCIIGSEMDAVKLAILAGELGYISELVTHPRNPDIKHRHVALNICVVAPETFTQQMPIDDQTAVILMTHSYSRDLAYLMALIALPKVTYLGMVGPKQRSNDLINELLDMNSELPIWFDQALRAPAGLDIGGEIPAEVALAILAEIQMVFAGHAGGELSNKAAGIHSPCEEDKGQIQLKSVKSSS